MLRRLAIVALLAFAGLVVGVTVTNSGPRSYIVGEEFSLPAHSNDAIRLAAVARSQHVQGVRVRVIDGDTLQVIGHGSLHGAARALNEVATQVRKAIKRMPGVTLRGLPFADALARPQGNAAQTGLVGLLAGLGVGLGLVVPSRARMKASQVEQPPEMPAGNTPDQRAPGAT
jgi:endonuclease YncB( thermonuclease family)